MVGIFQSPRLGGRTASCLLSTVPGFATRWETPRKLDGWFDSANSVPAGEGSKSRGELEKGRPARSRQIPRFHHPELAETAANADHELHLQYPCLVSLPPTGTVPG